MIFYFEISVSHSFKKKIDLLLRVIRNPKHKHKQKQNTNTNTNNYALPNKTPHQETVEGEETC